jgi:uncharacterized protein (DUF2336 family)
MIIRSYFAWVETAPAQARADAAAALANAWLYSNLSPEDRHEAEAALTVALDDGSPLVRRALSEALCTAETAPRHIIRTLAADRPDIAIPVLGRSPMLTDGELVDCLALGDVEIQAAIALRPHVSAGVAAALCEVAAMQANLALLDNPAAEVADFSLHRLAERFGEDALMRESLLTRPDLPARTRLCLTRAVGAELTAFAVGCGWMSKERGERLSGEARDQAAIIIAADSDADGVGDLVEQLRNDQLLTPQLLLRSVLSGEARLLEATVAMLTDTRQDRVAGILRAPDSLAFRALYRKSGLPEALEPAFSAALEALAESAGLDEEHGDARLSRRMIERVLTSCAVLDNPTLDRLMALLTRFQAEAAREEARRTAETIRREHRAMVLPDNDLDRRLQDALALELQVAA